MKVKAYYRIDFVPPGLQIAVRAGTDLLTAAHRAGISLGAGCGGQGTCGQCYIVVQTGQVSALLPGEVECLTPAQLAGGWRLACCVRAQSALQVYIPSEALSP